MGSSTSTVLLLLSVVLKQKEMNPKLIDLILRILVLEKERISIADIMSHPWMTMKLADKKMNINF
jgi:hypothetical protein